MKERGVNTAAAASLGPRHNKSCILSPAYFAGRRIYALAGDADVADEYTGPFDFAQGRLFGGQNAPASG